MTLTTSKKVAEILTRCGEAGFSERELFWAEHHLNRAEYDCNTLDESEEIPEGYFVGNFHQAMEGAPPIRVLRGYISFTQKDRGANAIRKAMAKCEAKGYTVYYLEHLRELVRDRWPVGLALKSIPAEFIAERQAEGDAAFFVQLGKELERIRATPQTFLRSFEAWILRAWIPLGIWRFKSAKQAWPLLRRAAQANAMGDTVAEIETSTTKWRQYVRAWQNARSRRR
ncbi:MAG: hypothetical protein U0984_12245 [Prosthecobacter sp.]|nr:hypothetical protein [Prosthecobacter sp.]